MTAKSYFDLYDFRRRVFGMYRTRNEALSHGEEPAAVCERFRAERDSLFATHPQSAYDAEQRRVFVGLDYFPYNPTFRVEARLNTDIEPERVEFEIGDRETVRMALAGVVQFALRAKELTLSLYWIDVYGGGLFLPFRDTTAPAETYGGGRYLFDTVKGSDFTQLPEGDSTQIALDFNYAYNPSCAYNYRWSCPLAPPSNHLSVPVRAGEKKPR